MKTGFGLCHLTFRLQKENPLNFTIKHYLLLIFTKDCNQISALCTLFCKHTFTAENYKTGKFCTWMHVSTNARIENDLYVFSCYQTIVFQFLTRFWFSLFFSVQQSIDAKPKH